MSSFDTNMAALYAVAANPNTYNNTRKLVRQTSVLAEADSKSSTWGLRKLSELVKFQGFGNNLAQNAERMGQIFPSEKMSSFTSAAQASVAGAISYQTMLGLGEKDINKIIKNTSSYRQMAGQIMSPSRQVASINNIIKGNGVQNTGRFGNYVKQVVVKNNLSNVVNGSGLSGLAYGAVLLAIAHKTGSAIKDTFQTSRANGDNLLIASFKGLLNGAREGGIGVATLEAASVGFAQGGALMNGVLMKSGLLKGLPQTPVTVAAGIALGVAYSLGLGKLLDAIVPEAMSGTS